MIAYVNAFLSKGLVVNRSLGHKSLIDKNLVPNHVNRIDRLINDISVGFE